MAKSHNLPLINFWHRITTKTKIHNFRSFIKVGEQNLNWYTKHNNGNT